MFGFTADHTIFAVLSASEIDCYSKETFSTGGLRFDVFSPSGLKGAHSRVLSLLALSLKNSMILGCDSATFSEFRGMIRVTFLDLMIRGGVEDTRLEAKDQGHMRNCFPKKKASKIFFRRSPIQWRTQNFDWGSLNHKSHEMKSSKFFPRRNFSVKKIS